MSYFRRSCVLLAVTCMIILGFTTVSHAQSEPFTWEPYDFTITPPDSWQVQANENELLLFAEAPTAADSPVISVVVVPPKILPPDIETDSLAHYSPNRRATSREVAYGDNIWPTIDEEMLFGGRRIAMALIAENFIVTWSAPADNWDAIEPLLTETVASINATPILFSPSDLLTQRLSWRGLSFDAPADWTLMWAGPDNHMLVTSRENQIYFSSTFRYGMLILNIMDVSALRSHLTTTSLDDFSLFALQPEMFDVTAIETEIVGDLSISSAPITDDEQEFGQALLIIAPEAAFLLVGVAGEAEWQATERALFEAILGTLTIE